MMRFLSAFHPARAPSTLSLHSKSDLSKLKHYTVTHLSAEISPSFASSLTSFRLFSSASSSSSSSNSNFISNSNEDSSEAARPHRPLQRNSSINSGIGISSPVEEPMEGTELEQEDTKRRRKLSNSLVGANVHDSYSSKKEKDRWRKRPLFSRAGYEVSFQTGTDAAALLMHEARRRDPYQTDFLHAVEDVVYDIAPAVELNPKLAWIFKQLMEPELFCTFRVPWKDDNHNTRINRGYLLQYSSTLGPYKGGLVFSQNLSHGIIRMLGWEQTLRNSLGSVATPIGRNVEEFEVLRKQNMDADPKDVGVGFGGLKGGSDFDPEDKSEFEIKRFCDAYLKSVWPLLSIDTKGQTSNSSFETDLNFGKKEITYFKESYNNLLLENGINDEENKYPSLFGSSAYYIQSSGYGCAYFAKRALEVHCQESMEGKRCVISGAGSMSRNIAHKLNDLGAKPVTLSDATGYIYVEDGITDEQIDLVEKFKLNNATLAEFARTNTRHFQFFPFSKNGGSVLERVKCDVAFACVNVSEVNSDIVQSLRTHGCKALFECMDRGVSQPARAMLEHEDILFATSKAVNCGSVVSSTFARDYLAEKGVYPTLAEIDANLEKRMNQIHDDVTVVAERYNMAGNLKAGANLLSFLRIAEREFFPKSIKDSN